MNEVFFDLIGRIHLPANLITQIEGNRLMESVLMVQLGIDFDPRLFNPQPFVITKSFDLEGVVHRLRTGITTRGRMVS